MLMENSLMREGAVDYGAHLRGLIVGVGNELRRDDGIGKRIAERTGLPGFASLTVCGIYPELADTLCAYDIVIFADAALDGPPVTFSRIYPDDSALPLCHGISCQGILALSEALYHSIPTAYLLSVRGYDFSYGTGLSDRARQNLEWALKYLKKNLEGYESIVKNTT